MPTNALDKTRDRIASLNHDLVHEAVWRDGERQHLETQHHNRVILGAQRADHEMAAANRHNYISHSEQLLFDAAVESVSVAAAAVLNRDATMVRMSNDRARFGPSVLCTACCAAAVPSIGVAARQHWTRHGNLRGRAARASIHVHPSSGSWGMLLILTRAYTVTGARAAANPAAGLCLLGRTVDQSRGKSTQALLTLLQILGLRVVCDRWTGLYSNAY